jgi:hypothetical protein
MKGKKKNNIYAVVFLMIVIVAVFISLNSGSNHILQIDSPEKDISVFLDNKEAKIEIVDGLVNVKVNPGIHNILVAKPTFWPWFEEIEIDEETENISIPFLIKEIPDTEEIAKESAEYNNIAVFFEEEPSTEKISKDGSTRAWFEDTFLFVQAGEKTYRVLENIDSVNNMEFYKDRNDALIVALGNSVFVIQANREDEQNFQPIFEGVEPDFRVKDKNSIYIKDGENIYTVSI